MSIRSKLLATVVLPAFSATIMMQPVKAETSGAPIILAQDSGEQPSDDQSLRQQQAEEMEREAEENRRIAEEQQRAAQEEADRQAAEQQRKVDQQNAIEEEARQKEAEDAARQAAEQQKAAEEEARRVAEQQQKAAQEEADRQAEEQKRASEQAQRDAAEQQKSAEQQKAIEDEAKRQANEAAEQSRPKENPDQQSAPAQPEEAPTAPVDQEPIKQPEEPVVPQVQPEQPEPQSPAPDEKPQDVEPVPAEQPDQQQPQPQPEQEAQQPANNPAPEPKAEIIDERTTEQKQEIAKDPASTDETVVLPVENGAAILDSDKDADNSGGNQSREERRKQREQQRAADEQEAPPPTDDAAAQVEIPAEVKAALPQKIEANLKEEGTRIKDAPAFVVPDTTNIVNNTVINNTVINNNTVNNVTNVKVVEQVDNRVILETGDRIFVRGDDRPRLRRDAESTYYDELPRGRLRETIVRPGGYEIVTVYDRYGDILQRSRIDRDGNEYLMIYAPEYDDNPRAAIFDVGYDLPPMRLTIPVNDYIIDVAADPERDFYDFLALPPVERVERVYTIDEVRHSARLRDKVRRIDLDTIHFATGSAEVSLSQAKTLRKVANAMQKVLAKDPGETFFIEGHTDAVGSDRSNLVLSDRRAESVASLLTEVYDIPAENLVTQGYGERFLKIRTQSAEQENRRVTIRRVTPLVRPVAQR
ncbi:OmpA family protein [Brucella pituitosa]|uniref:OmpA family protein n=1 Tax=Brucella pituitosa TaxID=571256 RepID=A0ABS3K2F3_9HYPH|nr:OmpA family protein [Brucella pituitosa]MBO1041095.1 OmpA family protein [Brucella pituitosa]